MRDDEPTPVGSEATKDNLEAQVTGLHKIHCLGKTLAPNHDPELSTWCRGIDESLKVLARLSSQEEGKETPQRPEPGTEPSKDRAQDKSALSVNQPTLEHTWSPDWEELWVGKSGPCISAHGPTHLGGRTTLHIHQEP